MNNVTDFYKDIYNYNFVHVFIVCKLLLKKKLIGQQRRHFCKMTIILSWCDAIKVVARKSMKCLLLIFSVYLILATIWIHFLSSITRKALNFFKKYACTG